MTKRKIVEITGIQSAIDKAGGTPAKLAELIGTSRQRVEYWLANGKVPSDFCPVIHQKTGVPLTRLNPKAYPVEILLRA